MSAATVGAGSNFFPPSHIGEIFPFADPQPWTSELGFKLEFLAPRFVLFPWQAAWSREFHTSQILTRLQGLFLSQNFPSALKMVSGYCNLCVQEGASHDLTPRLGTRAHLEGSESMG